MTLHISNIKKNTHDLICAINNGNSTDAIKALHCGADFNAIDEKGNTMIVLSTKKGLDVVVDEILQLGGNADHNTNSETALMCASFWNRKKIALSLLNGGANPLATDRDGLCPRDYAKLQSNIDILKILKTVEITR